MAYSLLFSLDQSAETAQSPYLATSTASLHTAAAASSIVVQDRVTLSQQALSSSSRANLLLFSGAKMDTSSDDVQLLQAKGYSIAQIAIELGIPLAAVEYELGIPAIDIAA